MTRYKERLPAGARVFESRLQVQWADVDIAGIMYFAAYWRFVEYAEICYFAELGFPYDTVFDEYDFWLPRVRAEAEYHAPALMNDWLRMRTHLEKVGASSVRWQTVDLQRTHRRTGRRLHAHRGVHRSDHEKEPADAGADPPGAAPRDGRA